MGINWIGKSCKKRRNGGIMEQEFLLLIDGSSLLTTQFFGNLPREILFAKTLEEKEKYFYKIMMDIQRCLYQRSIWFYSDVV